MVKHRPTCPVIMVCQNQLFMGGLRWSHVFCRCGWGHWLEEDKKGQSCNWWVCSNLENMHSKQWLAAVPYLQHWWDSTLLQKDTRLQDSQWGVTFTNMTAFNKAKITQHSSCPVKKQGATNWSLFALGGLPNHTLFTMQSGKISLSELKTTKTYFFKKLEFLDENNLSTNCT